MTGVGAIICAMLALRCARLAMRSKRPTRAA